MPGTRQQKRTLTLPALNVKRREISSKKAQGVITVSTRLATLLVLLAISASVNARTFDINVSDTTAQLKYGYLVGGSTYGRTETTFGVLYNDQQEGMAEIGLQVIDKAGSKMPGMELGIGPKLYVAAADKTDTEAVAIGLGGQIRYKHEPMARLVLGLGLYYAPAILTFEDAEDMYETQVQISYEILPTANVYVGHRTVRYDLKKGSGEETIDDGAHVGMQFRF